MPALWGGIARRVARRPAWVSIVVSQGLAGHVRVLRVYDQKRSHLVPAQTQIRNES